MNSSLELIYKKLQVARERKKVLEEIKLENNIDISGDSCYIILVGQISSLKALIKEIENDNRKHGGLSGAK